MRYLSIKTIHTATRKQGWIIFPYDSNQKILRLSYACAIKIARQNSYNNKPIINENKSYLMNLEKIFTIYGTERGWISLTYQELLKLTSEGSKTVENEQNMWKQFNELCNWDWWHDKISKLFFTENCTSNNIEIPFLANNIFGKIKTMTNILGGNRLFHKIAC